MIGLVGLLMYMAGAALGGYLIPRITARGPRDSAASRQTGGTKQMIHALISNFPEAALPEVEERLVEIFEDYVPQRAVPSLAGTFQPRVFMAEQGRRYPRPEIDIED